MEQKMAPGAGLTPRQEQLLDLAVHEKYVLDTFYLTGGTALSYWYLHHRQSDDIDFFSLAPFDYEHIVRWFQKIKKDIGYVRIRFDEDYGFLIVHLVFSDSTSLKVDFHYYSNRKIERGMRWHGLEIDTLMDIAVNKLHTIATIPRTRDYIDYYFIIEKEQWMLDRLIVKAEKKFSEMIDPLQLAKNLLKVSEYTDFPRMLVPFDESDMQRFYERLAGTLKSKILK